MEKITQTTHYIIFKPTQEDNKYFYIRSEIESDKESKDFSWFIGYKNEFDIICNTENINIEQSEELERELIEYNKLIEADLEKQSSEFIKLIEIENDIKSKIKSPNIETIIYNKTNWITHNCISDIFNISNPTVIHTLEFYDIPFIQIGNVKYFKYYTVFNLLKILKIVK
jgi:hypothetical protein